MIQHNVTQGSQEWHDLRCGKITSTRIKAAMGATYMDLLDELIAEQELGYYDQGNYLSTEMQWGTDYEPIAIAEYERRQGVTADRVGFLSSEKYPLIGLSPDSLIGKNGATEVKCPSTKKHIRTIRLGKIPVEHLPQIHFYFLIHEELEWLDFVSFDPRLERLPIFIKRITRAEIDLSEYITRIELIGVKLEQLKHDLFF